MSTKPSSALVVVDEGSKNHDDIVKQIFRSFSFRSISPEAVDAVFLRTDEVSQFEKSFNIIFSRPPGLDDAILTKLQQESFEHFAPGVLRIDLADMVSSNKKLPNLQDTINKATKAGVLLVVVYRTIDHVIDAFRQLAASPAYLSLLAPYSKANAEYFEKWTTSNFYSNGFIVANAPCCASSAPIASMMFTILIVLSKFHPIRCYVSTRTVQQIAHFDDYSTSSPSRIA